MAPNTDLEQWRRRASALAADLGRKVSGSAVEADMAAALGPTAGPYATLAAALHPPAELEAAALHLRLLAARLAARFDPASARIVLPPEEAALYPGELRRVVEGLLDERAAGFYSLANDDFLKELAILSHRLVLLALGDLAPRYVDPAARISRRILYARGARQLLKALRVILWEAGGFAPYFSSHLHLLNFKRDGGEDERAARLHRYAAVLRLNPRWRGLTTGGWRYDPQIERVSPHLAYLRRFDLAHGAEVFFLRRDVDGTSGALAASETRRRLFEAGEYVPELWLAMWPRKRLLRLSAAR